MHRRFTTLPFCQHCLGEAEEKAVLEVLRSSWITTGPTTAAFESEFAAHVGARHAIAVTSGTGGLFMVYQALGIGPGDEVVVPAMTWPATANAAALLGARIIFADVDYATLCVTRQTLEAAMSERTKAIAVVHFAGLACELEPIIELCRTRGVSLIEDSAHAMGTQYRGRHVGGDYAYASVYSFHPIKNITTGEGGMVTCQDTEVFRRLSLSKFHGVSREAWKAYRSGSVPLYDVEFPALKFNLTDIQSAIGKAQLPRLDSFLDRRRKIARIYLDRLADLPELHLPADGEGHAWNLFVIKINERSRRNRHEFIIGMREWNVGCGLHFLPLNELTYYRQCKPAITPTASKIGRTCVSLPLFPGLTLEDAEYVADCVRTLFAT